MSDCDIILTPNNIINSSDLLLDKARIKYNELVAKYGNNYTRLRLTKSYNSLGSIDDVTEDFAPINIFLFDRMKSDTLQLSGINTITSVNESKHENIRGYVCHDEDIVEGDYVITDYNSIDDSYTEKYQVVEKEAHEINGGIVFYTLYLKRERDI